MYYISKL